MVGNQGGRLSHDEASELVTRGAGTIMSTTNILAEKQVAEPRERKAAGREATHAGIAAVATVFQGVILAAHWFVYETWSLFWGPMSAAAQRGLAVSLAILGFSFLGVMLLAFRANNIFIRIAYRVAAVWLGALNFLVLASVAAWLAYGFVLTTSLQFPSRSIAVATFGAAALVSAWGLANAHWVRVKKITVHLPNLPRAWRGRTAVLVSDLHLGHVHHRGFSHRIVRKIGSLKPDVVFIAGDFFDGTHVDARNVAAPWKYLRAAFGAYFVTGNHELFRGESVYLDALRPARIPVLRNAQ